MIYTILSNIFFSSIKSLFSISEKEREIHKYADKGGGEGREIDR